MMMHRVLTLASGLFLFSACAIDDKSEPTKGEVDESEPPSDPSVAHEVQQNGFKVTAQYR